MSELPGEDSPVPISLYYGDAIWTMVPGCKFLTVTKQSVAGGKWQLVYDCYRQHNMTRRRRRRRRRRKKSRKRKMRKKSTINMAALDNWESFVA